MIVSTQNHIKEPLSCKTDRKSHSLICAAILCLYCSFAMAQYSPNYTVGIPVNDTLYTFSYSANQCSPDFDTYLGIYANPAVSGLSLYLLVDSTDNDVVIPPFGSVHKGDTIFVSPLVNSFQVYISYPGFVRLMLRISGIPLLANETYSCGNPLAMELGMNCGNFNSLTPITGISA